MPCLWCRIIGGIKMKKLTWFHHLGFYNNPFSIKPAAFHNDLMGFDAVVDEINDKVGQSSMIYLSGEYGTGKTTVLKGVINEFKGKKNVIYYSGNQSDKPIEFDRLLTGMSWWRILLSLRKKYMILLLDEVHDINKKDISKVKKLYNEGFFKSVIFVGKKQDPSKDISNLVEKNKYNLANTSKEQAVSLIRKRIGSLKFISDQMIVNVFNKNQNPRAFLKNVEEVCRHAFDNEYNEVTEKSVKAVLG